ncbi:MAG: Cof-type HAD-IIB family hydrolase [Treponema sp.]|nr:Cof-type HAD-IIB family hydrolase [Treponema sp.]MCL2251854.1 Cof-type HAD-IIB family hydrolase [Treponema sp.]
MNKKIDPKIIKALAIDLDGTTLMPGGILGEKTRACLKKLINNGMQIIISTGRAIEAAEKYRSAINATGPMVFFNGAEVADVPSGEILHTNCIGMDVVDFGTDIARELGIHYQVYLPAKISPDTGLTDPNQKWEALVIEKYTKDAEYYQQHTGIVPVIKDLKKIAALPLSGCIKGMFIADPSLHNEVRVRMKERFGDKITVMRSFPTFLEVINNGVSKGEGLRIAMEHRGLKKEEVIAFGDEENDVPMFAIAGFACVPENARDKIREEADFIYESVTKEGLALFLGELFG